MADGTKHDSVAELAERADRAFKELDAVFRAASCDPALDDLDKEGQRAFRKVRRRFARVHADAGDFLDEYVPDVITLSGGT